MLALSRGAWPVWNWPAESYSYEAVQPPLYYVPGSVLLRATPRWTPQARLHGLRLISALLHVCALALLWNMCLKLYQDPFEALGPVFALACVPMFAFIGATVTNDAAANVAGAGLLAYTMSMCSDPATSKRPPWLFGALIGVAALCKFTTLGVACACAAYLCLKRRLSPRDLVIAVLAALLVCGWFYARNFRLYGDFVGLNRTMRYDVHRYAWSEAGTWLLLYFESFWGRFGQMTQPMPPIGYGAAMALVVLSIFGWARHWRRIVLLPARKLLMSAYAVALAQNVYHGFFLSYQPQARYSFVALAAWVVLFWDGLSAWRSEFALSASTAARWSLAIPAALLIACGWFSV